MRISFMGARRYLDSFNCRHSVYFFERSSTDGFFVMQDLGKTLLRANPMDYPVSWRGGS